MGDCHYCRANEPRDKTGLHPNTEDGPQYCLDIEIAPDCELWEILVPTIDRDKTEYVKGFHKKWDAKVRAITGGLTIRPVEKGQWVHPASKNLVAERMIPVKIAATKEQILEICQMTAEYYNQEQVMAYRISDEVIFMRKDGSLA
jgi:hypothetical protein